MPAIRRILATDATRTGISRARKFVAFRLRVGFDHQHIGAAELRIAPK